MAMEAQWIDPITSEDTQPQRGPPGKKAPAAAGHKEEPPVRRQVQPQTRSKVRGGENGTTTWDREEHWRELSTNRSSRPQ